MRILSDCGVMDLKILHCKNDSVEQEKARPIHQYKFYQRCSSHWSYVTKKMHLIYFFISRVITPSMKYQVIRSPLLFET